MNTYTLAWLNDLIEDKWGAPVQSSRAWHEFKRGAQLVTVRHVALGYAVEGTGPEAEKVLCCALWEDLATLVSEGLLVVRCAPSLNDYKPAYDTNPPDYTKKEQTTLYFRLSFVDGPTEETLKTLGSYKPEGCRYTLLRSES